MSSVTVTQCPQIENPVPVSNDIQQEARFRLAQYEAQQRALENEIKLKAQTEADVKARQQRDELIRIEAEKMQVRLMAEKKVLEAEAVKLVDDRETKIKAEMERLKNRSVLEVIKDDMVFLHSKVIALEAQLAQHRMS